MLSLVGPAVSTEYDLPLVTEELQTRLDALYDCGRLSELVDPHAWLTGVASDFPSPPQTDWPRPRLGTIFWPVVGLARYAYACLLVDEYTLGQLRSQMASAVSNTVTVLLRDDPTDGAETAREIPLSFLASRPLVRTTSDALTASNNGTDPVDAWVLLLVDSRYATLTTGAASADNTSWNTIFTGFGVTVGDAPDADYKTPGTRWTNARASGRSTAWLADIAALAVGSRIVNVPGGTPTLQRPTSTNKTVLSSAHTAAGTRFFGGGPIEDADFFAGRPTSVDVVFGGFEESAPAVVNVSVQTDYAWPGSDSLSHWSSMPASETSPHRSALAAQWETDWAAWQTGLYDTAYNGFIDAPESGYVWNVVWDHSAETGTTRFSRPPHWYGYLLAPQAGSDPPVTLTVSDSTGAPPVTDVTTLKFDVSSFAVTGTTVTANVALALPHLKVEEKDGSPSYTPVVTIQVNQDDGFVLTQPAANTALISLPGASTLVGTPYTIPQYTVSGTGLQSIPQYVVAIPNKVTQYTVANVGDNPASTPVRQFVVDNTGTPTITQSVLTNGTGGGTGYVETVTATQWIRANTIAGVTTYDTVTLSGGVLQYVVGNATGAQGYVVAPTLSGSNVTQLVVANDVWDGGAIASAGYTVTASAGVATITASGKWDFSTATLVAPAASITGVLPIAHGGTGVDSFPNTECLCAVGSSTALASLANGAVGSLLQSAGAGTLPVWTSTIADTLLSTKVRSAENRSAFINSY